VSEKVPDAVVEALKERGSWLAVAESVSAGGLAQRAAAAPGASGWFRGGLVAWSQHTKHELLRVDRGPVVTGACAEQMARAVADLLDADVAVATTGVGGPEPVEGEPAGTVWVAVLLDDVVTTHRLQLDGDPGQVCQGAAEGAWRLLGEALS
jgi:nicotinamide-nucleotide amidase